MSPLNSTDRLQLGKSLRQAYLARISQGLEQVADAMQQRLTELLNEACPTRQAQTRRDAWMAFKSTRQLWMDRTVAAWGQRLQSLSEQRALPTEFGVLELLGTDAMEYQILCSRLVMAVHDTIALEWDDLQVRIKTLEGSDTLDVRDLLRPAVLLLPLVEQWAVVGMGVESWNLVSQAIGKTLAEALQDAFQSANNSLIQQGVLPVITLKDRVKARPALIDGGKGSGDMKPNPAAPTTLAAAAASALAEKTGAVVMGRHLARAKLRAQELLGQVKHLFASQTGNGIADMGPHASSPALQAALTPQALAARYAGSETLYQDYSPAGVARVALDLQEQSAELKQKAHTSREKATIEIVALMFQSILAEERIPPGVRVSFARLQMPVLRIALEDTGFLTNTGHPARLLIDRMGSCVMGFDRTGVHSAALETEIRHMVQVIEQYPESGIKVYEKVYADFQQFLAKFLTGNNLKPQVFSVAQQVEQKETLAIQYTIVMRDILKDVPVREEIRSFLFKVWAEVLALSALRNGTRHRDTQAFRHCATQLVWAASAKQHRVDRSRVIQELPALLARLRSGMALLGMEPSEQDRCIKTISATLADAFQSKTQTIPQDQIDALAQRLNQLEDLVSDDAMGDVLLDSESLEILLGLETAALELIAEGGSKSVAKPVAKPTAAMLAWVAELQTGAWFTLDYQGQTSQVQLVWRSERKQLHLLAATTGKSYLIQAKRLAAYVQAGLLLPQEEESLTMRATRNALATLQANPQRLLGS
ncbi:MAG: DUF1631 family protein [Rhodoferax sp.]|nr:DUF1631 family protein [Rhodoferax sp.]